MERVLLKLVLAGVLISLSVAYASSEALAHQTEEKRANIYEEHPTVKCEEIITNVGEAGPENHRACLAHCITLRKGFNRGHCLEGVCQCSLEQGEAIHRRGKPTIRCEHIIPIGGTAGPHNHEACKAHCHNIGPEYAEGVCVEGVCHCVEHAFREEIRCDPHNHEICAKHCKALSPQHEGKCAEGVCRCEERARLGHPTVRCEHLVPLKARPSAENHELCLAHCRNLGGEYDRGECREGICHCQQRRYREIVGEYPTVKCEHIHPIRGFAGPENHEACTTHCRDISKQYLEGSCAGGICRCKTGAVVTPIVKVSLKEVIRCEDIKPIDGVAWKNHHEACLSHCITLKNTYKTGLCSEGICHCQ